MNFFAGTDTDNFHFDRPAPDQSGGNVGDLCGGNSRNVRFTRRTALDGCKNHVYCVVETQQKARHIRRGNGYGSAVADLVVKQRNHGTPRRQDIAIPHAHKAGIRATYVCLDKHALL